MTNNLRFYLENVFIKLNLLEAAAKMNSERHRSLPTVLMGLKKSVDNMSTFRVPCFTCLLTYKISG